GALTGSDSEDHVEDFLAHLTNSRFSFGDTSGVNIHIVAHPLESRRVGGDFNYRDRGKADGRSASGCEGDQVAAAGSEAGQRRWVVAWSVHEDEAGAVDAFGVVDDFV